MSMTVIEALEKASQEQDIPLLCAKRKDGSWLIYIAPEAKDTMGLLMNAALEIETNKQAK